MLVAGAVTILFRKLRQPVVLGYILAGLIIGPHTPPYALITDLHVIETLAELGVILLMFSLGLHFSVSKLATVGATASIAALMEIGLMLGAGYGLGLAFGWSRMDSLFLGAILSISSTTIIIKALEDLRLTTQRFAEITFGILIVEDIAAILILALLSGIAVTGTLSMTDAALTSGRLAMFLACVLVVGLIAAPRLLAYLVRVRSNEMTLVVLLAICFGVSLLALKLGYSVALGAFLAGAVLAESRHSPRAAELIEPVRDMFSAVFFVAVGMLINPALLWQYLIPIAVISVVAIFGKIVACAVGAFLGGAEPRTALRTGMSLAQIGEFSFIIATLGETLNVTSEFLYPIAVAVSAITTLTTPYLIRGSDVVADRLSGWSPPALRAAAKVYSEARPLGHLNDTGNAIVRKAVRQSLLQIAVNLLLVAGLFIGAGALEPRAEAWLPGLPPWTGGARTLLWFAAVLATLPMHVAVLRKLQALSMIMAEMSIDPGLNAELKQARRSMLTSVILVFSISTYGVSVLIISSALLPPWPVLLVLLALLWGIAWRIWGHLIRVYARAQTALRDTLAEELPDHTPAPEPVQELLRGVALCTVEIAENTLAAGRLIREINLRAITGASIIGIERGGEAIINPDPNEEILVGDQVVVLGNPDQLTAAEQALLRPA
jgi:CPA2 family monovalent cation:H+ antiporter-2